MEGNMSRPSRRLSLGLLFTGVMCFGCAEPAGPAPSAALAVRLECPPATSDSYFFAEESLVPESPAADRTQRTALSAYLRAANEVSLSCGHEPEEGYRVFWGGGYGVPAVVGSIVRSGSSWRAAATEFIPPSSGQRYVVARHSTRPVDAKEMVGVSLAIESAAFWTTAVWREMEGEGTIWMIEARQGGRYRAVSRVQPDEAFAIAAHLLVGVAGMAVPARMTVRH